MQDAALRSAEPPADLFQNRNRTVRAVALRDLRGSPQIADQGTKKALVTCESLLKFGLHAEGARAERVNDFETGCVRV